MSRTTLQIDLASAVPAYRQISSGLRTMLVDGTLAPGAQLPTVRRLALDLGVHHNTVAEAYRVLADEGWIEMRRRHGVTVLDRAQPKPSSDSRESFVRRLRELTAEAQSEGLAARTIAGAMRAVAGQMAVGKGGKP
jgi:DNA-binding transcriptional regulator YhcF (GntR family)